MTKYQVVGIGNAVVDIISRADDDFLNRMGIEKGVMQLIDEERCAFLYDNMEDRTQMAGGSVANTIAGIGALGLDTAFIGRVSDDEAGRDYVAEMKETGTSFVNEPVIDGELPTSRSMIFVSPDGERSMNTYLGISTELSTADVDQVVTASTQLLFLEGYLYDKDKGKEALLSAARTCRDAGGKAGITLSDPFCVERHRMDFRKIVRELDFVIGNEHEWCSLYETDDLSTAIERAATESKLIVCTRSGHDVVIANGKDTVSVPVNEVAPVDTTGAGDQFAAGFLYGLATGTSLDMAGRMGCIAAAEVIGHFGARPEKDVKTMFAKAGLI